MRLFSGTHFALPLAILAILAISGAPALAKGKGEAEYDGHKVIVACKLKEQGNSNWIPTEVLVLDDGAGGYLVIDPVTYHFVGKPVPGKLAVNNAVRRTFSWTTENTVDNARQYAGMSYRLTVPKAGGQATISGKPLGYWNDYFGAGSCDSL